MHRFTSENVIELLTLWVQNDLDYLKRLTAFKESFRRNSYDGNKLADASIHDIKRNISSDHINEQTLEIMLLELHEWRKAMDSDLKTKSADEVAHVLWHYPLNKAVAMIKHRKFDGTAFMDILCNQPDVIRMETGWSDVELEQIQLLFGEYASLTRKQILNNIQNAFDTEHYKSWRC